MFYLKLALAGGAGVVLRVLLQRFTIHMSWLSLPFGTLIANILGSFLIGFLVWSFTERWLVSQENQIIVLSGLLGGFTTFSAFSLDTIQMLQSGQITKALLYLVASVALSVVACWIGLVMAKAAF